MHLKTVDFGKKPRVRFLAFLIFFSDEEIKKAENIEINAENYIAAQNELHNLNLKCAKLEAEKREIKWKVRSGSYL